MDRQRLHAIGIIALPIIGGMASQNVLNLVDTAMVGSLGNAALAAVGMGSFANFMAQAFITGMSAGVQATAARRLGEGRTDETAIPLNGGLLLAVGLAIPWALLLLSQASWLFPLLSDDPAVIAIGVPYFCARLVGMAGVGSNFAFRGYWNGVNLSGLYLRTLLVMH
ncbi:MAG: MATE family multidrug resistance protein, partial [Myxococcota bacterium]